MTMTETQSSDRSLDLVLTRFRLRARRRALWLRKLWREEGEPGGNLAVSHEEMETHLAGLDSPEAETAWLSSEPKLTAWNEELQRVEAELAGDDGSRLMRLRDTFGLDDNEFDIFQACLAVALDPALCRVCGYLQDHAGRCFMTEHLATRLFGYQGTGIVPPQSPLKRWRLLTECEMSPGVPRLLSCDPHIVDWLRGGGAIDPMLLGTAELVQPHPPLQDWPVEATVELLERQLRSGETAAIRIRIDGTEDSGRRTLAAVISSRLGLPLLAIDADRIEDARWQELFVIAQRQAYLERCALAWHGEQATRRRWPAVVHPFPVQFLIADGDQQAAPVAHVVEHRIQMPVLTIKERKELWRQLSPADNGWEPEQSDAFLERHRLTVGQMTAICRRGAINHGEAVEIAREMTRHRLGKLAQLLECPFLWDDLVLADELKETLQDLLYEARNRGVFFERPEARRLYPQGRGLLALFSGSPGTGKTMAAQVIAADLGVDLFRIDLSTVVSKYVGETSENLERILSQTRHMDAVLLFDEADALFGKRTEIKDAHDRFANTDTAYLLQAIENYQGVALLTTNKKGNIDPAFIRRIRYVIEFPKPDATQRLEIWQRVVGELVGKEQYHALTKDLPSLANNVETTGAQIKFAVLAAIFAAQRENGDLGVKHLLRGLDHEFAKEGRALSPRERERLQGCR